MYSIAKINYTTITMNKEGTARFGKKKQKKTFKKTTSIT